MRELEEQYAKKEATALISLWSTRWQMTRAIAWLESYFAGRNMSGLIYVASTIVPQRLRNHPRYQDLLQRMHLRV